MQRLFVLPRSLPLLLRKKAVRAAAVRMEEARHTPEFRMAAVDLTAAAFIVEAPTEDLAFLRTLEAAAAFRWRECRPAAAMVRDQLAPLDL